MRPLALTASPVLTRLTATLYSAPQVQRQANEAVGAPSVSGMAYQPIEGSESSLFHAMGDAEYRGRRENASSWPIGSETHAD